MKVLTHSNYIIRQNRTHKAQFVHRQRLRPFKLEQPKRDITVNETDPYPEPNAKDDAEFFSNNIPSPNLTGLENHHIHHNQEDQEPEEQTVHITDNDVKGIQPPTTQINQPATGQTTLRKK